MSLSSKLKWGAELKANVVDIKRFAVHDGDGIRTTVFLKGCPLSCVWCHNPESIAFERELAYYRSKCIVCGECVEVCPTGSHRIKNNEHVFERSICVACGKCETACPSEALRFYGREMTADEVFEILLEDRAFYESSGGGITLSGGECLCQAEFCVELLKKCKQEGINTAVDTCGFVGRENLDKVIAFTDTFLYDIKAIDEGVHIRCTGRSNKQILENIEYLDFLGKAIEVRIPYVPEFNHDQPEKIAKFLKKLKNVKSVKVLPYHNFAGSKYEALGKKNTLPLKVPDEYEIQSAQKLFSEVCL